MASTGPGAVLLHGWWGDDGQSDAGLFVYTMGWWNPEEASDTASRLAFIEAYLLEHKFLFINTDGDLEEGDFSGFTP